MSDLTAVAVALVVVALGGWALAAWIRGRSEAQVTALRQEIQTLLATQAQSVATHIGQLAHSVTQQLGQVTQQLQTGVTDTCTLASNAQQAVAARLAESTEMLGTIRQQLGEVQQAGRELSGAARTIELVLGGAQTRGSLGEVALERMLSDALPQAGYELSIASPPGRVSMLCSASATNSRPLIPRSRWMTTAERRNKGRERARGFLRPCALMPTSTPRR